MHLPYWVVSSGIKVAPMHPCMSRSLHVDVATIRVRSSSSGLIGCEGRAGLAGFLDSSLATLAIAVLSYRDGVQFVQAGFSAASV
jgi:hypothetical protein